MPSSQAAASERRNDKTQVAHEPPKLKTTLKTPPKQATNPLQFVKVGPCSLYRSAQEQLQKVQETKKIKQEVRDDPEDWQSNLDNWKSSRRKRQEHIIERVVEVKKLELEEHDRQRRRSKTFSEMMEERGSRGRKLSMSLAMYHEDDVNDLSDLGIGTSSGKSSVSGDTHDDMHSVLSDRDSEMEKNHSDVENATGENDNANDNNNATLPPSTMITTIAASPTVSNASSISKRTTSLYHDHDFHNDNDIREYDSANTATASSPEPEEYACEGAIRAYMSRVSQNLTRRTLIDLRESLDGRKFSPNEEKLYASDDDDGDDENNSSVLPVVKVDVHKRRQVFERTSPRNNNIAEIRANNINNNSSGSDGGNGAAARSSGDSTNSKLLKERQPSLEIRNNQIENDDETASAPLSNDMHVIHERLSNLEKKTSEYEMKHGTLTPECSRPLGERLADQQSPKTTNNEIPSSLMKKNIVVSTMINDNHSTSCFNDQTMNNKNEGLDAVGKGAKTATITTTASPSERSSSPDSEYRVPRATFHTSLDSLDADASSGPDTFERVHSLEELDYTTRYPASSSSAELLHDTDREDSGIHTADVSCSVSQADEPVDEELVRHPETIFERQETCLEVSEGRKNENSNDGSRREESILPDKIDSTEEAPQRETAVTFEDTAETSTSTPSTCSTTTTTTTIATTTTTTSTTATTPSGILSNKKYNSTKGLEVPTNKCNDDTSERESCSRPIVYQSPVIPPRRNPPSDAAANQSQLSDTWSFISREHDHGDCANRTTIDLTSPAAESESMKSRRSVSKIPTALPRKSLLNVKTSTESSSSSPTVSSPSASRNLTPQTKFINKFGLSGQSKIPYSTTAATIVGKTMPRSNEEASTPLVVDSRSMEKQQTTTTVLRIDDEPNNEEKPIVDEASEYIEIREESPESVIQQEEEEEEGSNETNATRSSLSSKRHRLQHQHQRLSEISQELETNSVDEIPVILQQTIESLFETPSASSKQIPQLNLTSDEELVNGSMTFPLGPPSSAEPPKEKPPPPPTDLSDDEEHSMPVEPLKRLNSTRRIKKELRTRRSDFLGIEGMNDDYLERELTLTKPPDMAAILAEERRIEQLNRRSYDTDSNYERDSSHERDSGVELGHTEEWSKQPVSPDMSQHSRQSSEPFGASVTSSEEDEITKKEREIIEILEKEEQWRYGNDREHNRDIGEKLAHKLRQLEEEKMQLERERTQETTLRRRQEEATLRKQQEQRETARLQQKTAEEKRIRDDELLKVKSEQLRIQEEMEEENERRSAEARKQEETRIRTMEMNTRRKQMTMNNGHEDEVASGEVRRVERELLQLEQEELKRRRTNVAYRQQKQLQLAEQLHQQWQSLQDVARGTITSANNSPRYKYQTAPIDYRSSMPNLQLQEHQRRRPPPPPIPPSKPLRLVEQMQRDVSIRNSRMPSADSIPQQVDAGLGHGGSLITMANHPGQQQMTKQTLQALSAVPRSRIVKGDQWVQRRKSDIPRGTHEYNYQHWLIQEAEQRRISEKNHRSIARKAGQQHATGTSVPYTAVVQSSSRFDEKPLPDSIIQTLTQRVQNRTQERPPPPPPPPPPPHRRRLEQSASHEHLSSIQHQTPQHVAMLQRQKVHQFSTSNNTDSQEKMLSVSGKKKCSHCGDELGRGAAMIIESLRLFYHMECFKCCVCHVRLGDGLMGTDVRVRNHKLHCHNCYSSDDGVKFSCV